MGVGEHGDVAAEEEVSDDDIRGIQQRGCGAKGWQAEWHPD